MVFPELADTIESSVTSIAAEVLSAGDLRRSRQIIYHLEGLIGLLRRQSPPAVRSEFVASHPATSELPTMVPT